MIEDSIVIWKLRVEEFKSILTVNTYLLGSFFILGSSSSLSSPELLLSSCSLS